MDVTTTGKQMDVGPALQTHVSDSLTELVGKYFERATSAQVTLTREAHRFRADVLVHAARHLTVQGGGTGEDAYKAFDSAAERIAKQLRRYKRRIKNHRVEQADVYAAQQYVISGPAGDEAESDDASEPAETSDPLIIAETETQLLKLSVSEAVMHMNLRDQPALMFMHRSSGRMNVVYTRPDGHIGWIDPAE